MQLISRMARQALGFGATLPSSVHRKAHLWHCKKLAFCWSNP